MPLTVLQVAFPLAPVGPDAVGGAEQVLTHLDAALVRAGHRSIVVACEGSVVAGDLVATPAPPAELDDRAKRLACERQRLAVLEALEHFPVDVVHLHGLDFMEYLPPPGVPVLVTLHLPPDWYPAEAFQLDRPETYLHAVSASQQRACPTEARLLPPIQNGVDIERLQVRHAKRGFALALGRICPEKGYHFALEAARRADVPMLLAGEVFPYSYHMHYFREEIQPRLDGGRRYTGPAGFGRKRRLLTAARCLLVPSLAQETSSLVAMEALACGTPVVAFRAGALPEIVEHARTGFIVDGVEEMAAAIRAADALDLEACRAAARERFSLERTTRQYLDTYELLAAGRGAELLSGSTSTSSRAAPHLAA